MVDGSKFAPTFSGVQKPGRSPCGTNTAPKRLGATRSRANTRAAGTIAFEQRQGQSNAGTAQNVATRHTPSGQEVH